MVVITRTINIELDVPAGGLLTQFSTQMGVGDGTAPGLLTSPAVKGIKIARLSTKAANNLRMVSLLIDKVGIRK
jgi:hypothetical protein